jgi:hypothetical protein
MADTKISALTAATSVADADLIPIVQGGANKKATRELVRGHKVYTALLTQTSTNAPTATVLENTLGGTVVWARSIAGTYTATLAGAFPAAKTVVTVNCLLDLNLGTGGTYVTATRTSDDVLTVYSASEDSIVDGAMGTSTSIIVMVYP